MAYTSACSVARLCRNLLGQEKVFSQSSCPTLNDVNEWLSSGCSIIESTLAGCRYTVPVASGTTAYGWLSDVNALYGAGMAEMSRTTATVSTDERTRGQVFLEMFWTQLDRLCDSDLSLAGLERANTGPLYVGGTKHSVKRGWRQDTDRVGPRFWRGLGRGDEVIYPTDSGADDTSAS